MFSQYLKFHLPIYPISPRSDRMIAHPPGTLSTEELRRIVADMVD
jgi:hypothetical protein